MILSGEVGWVVLGGSLGEGAGASVVGFSVDDR